MTAPHQTDAFRNSCEYTLSVTFRVAGGARQRTALARARRIAERIVDYAARAAGVVEVSATAGPSQDGLVDVVAPVRFSRANTGTGTARHPGRLDRYLDPEHERAVQSLAAANTASRERRSADQQRRRAVGCRNPDRSSLLAPTACPCAYCRPAEHEVDLRHAAAHRSDPTVVLRCPCGSTTDTGTRCRRHRDVRVVVLDSDPAPLRRLVELLALPWTDRHPDSPDLPGPTR